MIEYHADDFGFFPCQSMRIMEAVDEGVVNAISIVVNSAHFKECMALLENRSLKTALHINIVSGKSVSGAGKGLLLDKDDEFKVSFITLLIASCIPFIRDKYKTALKSELLAQVELFSQYFSNPLRIDSHCHYHMIPVVFDALVDTIKENNINVEYIRFPEEKRLPGMPGFVSPVNLIKTNVLRILCRRNRKKHARVVKEMKNLAFFGILHRGNMYKNPVQNIRKHVTEDCEILFHPGGCYESEDLRFIKHKGDLKFFSSENRNRELQTLKDLRETADNVGSNRDYR